MAKLRRRVTLDTPASCSLIVLGCAIGGSAWAPTGCVFYSPDEIDADRGHYQKLLEKWGSDEAIDDMEHAFGSLFWQRPSAFLAWPLAPGRTKRLLKKPRSNGSDTPGSTAAWVISSSIAALRTP